MRSAHQALQGGVALTASCCIAPKSLKPSAPSTRTLDGHWSERHHPALVLVLSQYCCRKVLFTCAPLVCKAWRDAAVEAATLVELHPVVEPSRLESLGLWLLNHAPAAGKQLSISRHVTLLKHAGVPGPTWVLHAALQAAAAAGLQAELQLEGFCCNIADASSLTRYFSPNHLTQLRLSSLDHYSNECPPSETATALARLSNLRALDLSACTRGIPEECISTLSSLTALTSLTLRQFPNQAPLNCLPAQLLELTLQPLVLFGAAFQRDVVPLNITHLQQLRRFSHMAVRRGSELVALRHLPNLTAISLTWFDLAYVMRYCKVKPQQWYPEESEEPGCWVGHQLKHLTSLHLDACPNAAAIIGALPASVPSTLMSLRVTHSRLSRECLSAISALPLLEDVELSRNRVF